MIELTIDPPKKRKPELSRLSPHRDRSVPIPPSCEAVDRVRHSLEGYGKIAPEMQADLQEFLSGRPGTDCIIRAAVAHECKKEGIYFTPAKSPMEVFIEYLKGLLRLK